MRQLRFATMGGYGFGFEVTVKGGGKKVAKPTEQHAEAVLAPLWITYRQWLDKHESVAPKFISELVSYWELCEEDAKYYRCVGNTLDLHLPGCGGEADNMAECTAHIMTLLSDEEWTQVEQVLLSNASE